MLPESRPSLSGPVCSRGLDVVRAQWLCAGWIKSSNKDLWMRSPLVYLSSAQVRDTGICMIIILLHKISSPNTLMILWNQADLAGCLWAIIPISKWIGFKIQTVIPDSYTPQIQMYSNCSHHRHVQFTRRSDCLLSRDASSCFHESHQLILFGVQNKDGHCL